MQYQGLEESRNSQPWLASQSITQKKKLQSYYLPSSGTFRTRELLLLSDSVLNNNKHVHRLVSRTGVYNNGNVVEYNATRHAMQHDAPLLGMTILIFLSFIYLHTSTLVALVF